MVIKAEEEKELLALQLKDNEPKVEFYERIACSEYAIPISSFAKSLNIGPKKLFKWLRENNYLMSDNSRINYPYQKYMDSGYFEVIQSVRSTPYGEKIDFTTRITGKGQTAIYKKLVKDSPGMPPIKSTNLPSEVSYV